MATIESSPMKLQPNDEATLDSQTKVEPLNEAQRQLAAKYMPLALSLARSFSKNWKWITDEMESVALLALVEAARSYDISYNVKFSTYAKRGIFGALTNARNKYKQLHRNANTDVAGHERYAWVNNSSDLTYDEYADYLLTCEENRSFFSLENSFEFREELETRFRRLPPRHARFMKALYFEQKSMDEMTSQFRCKPLRLHVMHRESINMLLCQDAVPMPRKSRRPRAEKRAIEPRFSPKTVPDRPMKMN